MKKFKKRLLITAGCMMVAGAIVCATGFAMGGSPEFTVVNHKLNFPAEAKNYVEKKETLKDIKNIELHTDNGNIYIEQGEDFHIEYGYYESVQEMQVKKEGDKTSYKMVSPAANQFFSIGIQMNTIQKDKSYIKLVVPADTKFTGVTGISDYGEVHVSGIHADKLTVEAESGDATLNNLTAVFADIYLQYGDLLLTDSNFTRMDVYNESGPVTLEKLDGEQMNIELGYGTAKVSQIHTNEMDLSNQSGQILLSEVSGFGKKENLKKLLISDEYGDIKIADIKTDRLVVDNESGSLEGDNLTLEVGKITLDYGELNLSNLNTKDIEIENESGNIILGLTKPEKEYDFDLRTDGGKIKINGTDSREWLKSSNTAQSLIKAKTEYGSIKITTGN